LVLLLERLIVERSKPIVKGILTSFVESIFFKSLAVYYGNRISDVKCSLSERKQVCLSGIKVLVAMMDMFPSRFEQFREVVNSVSSEAELLQMTLRSKGER